MLPGTQVSDNTLAEIYAQSRGNPLFVRELVDGIRLQGESAAASESPQGSWWLAAQSQSRARVLTAMRLALMDDPLRRVLGLAATVGAAEISLEQLRAGAAALEPPMAVAVLFDALDRALQMHILEERDEGYAFRHPIVRAALYDCLPRHRRDEFRAAHGRSRRRKSHSVDRLFGRTDLRRVKHACGWRPLVSERPFPYFHSHAYVFPGGRRLEELWNPSRHAG
jgi:predicted ATPase